MNSVAGIWVHLPPTANHPPNPPSDASVTKKPDHRASHRRQLLIFRRCARKHGRHTFRIDIEGKEYQRLVARVSPLVREGLGLVDQRSRSPCFRLAVDRIRPGAGNDIVQRCA
jgi:hypothetical protein